MFVELAIRTIDFSLQKIIKVNFDSSAIEQKSKIKSEFKESNCDMDYKYELSNNEEYKF